MNVYWLNASPDSKKTSAFFPSLWAHHCSIVLWATRINHHPPATSSGTNFQTPRHTFGISCLALAERQLWRRFQVSPKGEMKLPYVLSRRVGQEFATGLGPVAAGWGLGWVGPSRECEKCIEMCRSPMATIWDIIISQGKTSSQFFGVSIGFYLQMLRPKVTKPETWEEASDSWTVLNMGSGCPDTWECCGISSQIWIPWPGTWEDCQVSVYRNRPKSGWAAVWMDVLGFRHSPPATGISLEVRSVSCPKPPGINYFHVLTWNPFWPTSASELRMRKMIFLSKTGLQLWVIVLWEAPSSVRDSKKCRSGFWLLGSKSPMRTLVQVRLWVVPVGYYQKLNVSSNIMCNK